MKNASNHPFDAFFILNTSFSILCRRLARALLEATAEVFRVGEAASVGNLGNGLLGVGQQLAGVFDASLVQQVLWCDAHGLLQLTLQA